MSLEDSLESPRDAPRLPPGVGTDVPAYYDVLPDGRETVIIGDVPAFREHCHVQGDNPFGYRGTCGLCSCEGILRQFGIEVTESDVVAYAIAHGLCHTEGSSEMRGGTTAVDQIRILSDFGVPAHYEAGGFVDAATMDEAWVKMGGTWVVTDRVHGGNEQRTHHDSAL